MHEVVILVAWRPGTSQFRNPEMTLEPSQARAETMSVSSCRRLGSG